MIPVADLEPWKGEELLVRLIVIPLPSLAPNSFSCRRFTGHTIVEERDYHRASLACQGELLGQHRTAAGRPQLLLTRPDNVLGGGPLSSARAGLSVRKSENSQIPTLAAVEAVGSVGNAGAWLRERFPRAVEISRRLAEEISKVTVGRWPASLPSGQLSKRSGRDRQARQFP